MGIIYKGALIALLITTASATAESLSTLAVRVLEDQEAWLMAVEDSRRISISKAAPRVKRQHLESNQVRIDELVSKLSISRQDYRNVVMSQIFKGNKPAESTFEVLASQGGYYCFAAQGGYTGFCTEESSNKTFTW